MYLAEYENVFGYINQLQTKICVCLIFNWIFVTEAFFTFTAFQISPFGERFSLRKVEKTGDFLANLLGVRRLKATSSHKSHCNFPAHSRDN